MPDPRRDEATVFIVDPHSIFRLGMATCLETLPLIGGVAGADSVVEAWAHPGLAAADLVIVDAAAPEIHAFVHELRATYSTPVLASGTAWDVDEIATILEAGAVGVLTKDSLTPSMLEANVRAALQGAAVLPSEIVGRLLGGQAGDLEHAPRRSPGQLNTREQEVLRLIAEGHATREVAAKLCYSERTIKNVLHDAATKLGARSRSHAVAHAVRSGLI